MLVCPFCSANDKIVSEGFRRVTESWDGQPPTEVIAVSNEFMLIHDAAPVDIGHVLLITKSHVKSFLRYWNEKNLELARFIVAVENELLSTKSRRLVVFEHGMGDNCPTDRQCVEHAHLHLLPLDCELVGDLSELGVEFKELQFGELFPNVEDSQYLFLRDTDGSRYIAIDESFPKQALRRVMAKRLNEKFFSWCDVIEFPDKRNIQSRLSSTRELLKNFQTEFSLDEK